MDPPSGPNDWDVGTPWEKREEILADCTGCIYAHLSSACLHQKIPLPPVRCEYYARNDAPGWIKLSDSRISNIKSDLDKQKNQNIRVAAYVMIGVTIVLGTCGWLLLKLLLQ
jgi:hypothetical protein